MKRSCLTKLAVVAWLTTSTAAHAGPPRLLSFQAKNHIWDNATVCGLVVSTEFVESDERSPTFLDLDHPRPDQPFTIVIWGDHREKFGTPDVTLANKRVCVTGMIQDFRGTPEIVATDPSQIRLQ
jgi:DNA/RNA endonuclease YhcR with UshA esterase domain